MSTDTLRNFEPGCIEGLNKKTKVTMIKAYGFRTDLIIKIALYHALGKLLEPELTHSFQLTSLHKWRPPVFASFRLKPIGAVLPIAPIGFGTKSSWQGRQFVGTQDSGESLARRILSACHAPLLNEPKTWTAFPTTSGTLK
ncbi:MAG: family transposase [Caballeronia mineralivorans]|jgi:hypothetical protein|nr:family transposase [Caballeronia mineralivorans]